MKRFVSAIVSAAQVILWSVLFVNTVAICVGQIVIAGCWEWWMLGLFALVILSAIGLKKVWKEYKEENQ